MKTLDKNRLIAEFMQPTFEGFGTYEFNGYLFSLNELEFHCSWDWIMPVVDKIESLGYFVEINYWIAIYNGTNKSRNKIYLSEDSSKSKLEKLLNGVVAFIEYYNNLNNTSKN